MKCELKFKDAVYSSELFCSTCGMDIGLSPIAKRAKIKKGKTSREKLQKLLLYCCKECAENG